jgi:acid phosphatase
VTYPAAPNLAAQLRAAGRTFVGYAESLPASGYQGCGSGDYARKHAPWVDFLALPRNLSQPFSRFPASFARLPTVAFVVPNLCNDMHSCSVATGDRWARAHLAPYVQWARTHASLLIVTFDEDDGSSTNHIPTFLVGPMVRPGSYRQVIDHYNVLRTLEEMYGLAPLGEAARARPLACWSPSS